MDELRKNFVKMLDAFICCSSAMKGIKFSNDQAWKVDAENLALKFFFHLGSVYQLQEGTTLPEIAGITPNYVDFPSISVVTRAALEAYLCFNFIYIQPETDDEKEFRHDIWKLGGLLDRQRFVVTTDEGIEKLKEEQEIIENIKDKITSNQIYTKLTDPRKKEATSGKWKLGKQWVEIAEKSGTHKDYFVSLYAYLCSFAHSGHLGILQLSQANNRESQSSLSRIYTHVNLILASHFIFDYSSLFHEVKEYLNNREEIYNFVSIYYMTEEHWNILLGKA